MGEMELGIRTHKQNQNELSGPKSYLLLYNAAMLPWFK